jgi:hypothetical protein
MDALAVAVVLVATMVNPGAVWFNAARLTVAPVLTTAVRKFSGKFSGLADRFRPLNSRHILSNEITFRPFNAEA